MKNTISDLNNYLFEQLERLNDDDLTMAGVGVAKLRVAIREKRKSVSSSK